MPQPVEGAIEIRFGSEVYRGNYINDLAVEEGQINSVLISQPPRYVFWAKLASLSRMLFEQAKLELERYDAQLYTFIRHQKEVAEEKVTEGILSSAISLDQGHQDRNMAVLRAKLQFDHLDAIKEAFSQRSQLLMSVSANLREEWETSLELRQRDPIKDALIQKIESATGPKAEAIKKALR